MLRTKLADLLMPWAAGNASVWPSQHSVHAGLVDEIRELEALRAAAVGERDEALALLRQASPSAIEALDREWWERREALLKR